MADREDERKEAEETAKGKRINAESAEQEGGKREGRIAGHSEDENKKQTLFCPWCGRQIPDDSIYCEYCGGYVPEDDKSGGQTMDVMNTVLKRGKKLSQNISGRRFGKKLIALVIFALLAFFGVHFFSGKKLQEIGAGVFYIKDNSLIWAGDSGKRSQEYSSQYQANWGKRIGGGILESKGSDGQAPVSAGAGPVWSEDGRYLFYPEQIEGSGFNLVRLDRKKGEAKTLDTGVAGFILAALGQVVYCKENEALYVYGDSRKRKLSRGPKWYQVSEAGDSVLWTEETAGVTDIWYEPLEGKEGGKTRLERNAVVLDASGDFGEILIKKENSVYQISSFGEPRMLAEEVSSTACADAKTVSFYFVRDVNRTPITSYQELYFYGNGESTLISDDLGTILWRDRELILYTVKGDRDCYLAYKGKASQLGREAVIPGQVERKGDALYFLSLSGEEDEGTPLYNLCRASLSEKDFGLVMDVDSKISGIACATENTVYYLKDVNMGQGDLYENQMCVAYDVAVGSAAQIPGSEAVLCIADYSAGRQKGTITLIKSGESRVLAHGISGYCAASENEIYLLAEYLFDKERGDLLFCDGREVWQIDTNIWSICGLGSSRICRSKVVK